MQAALIVFDHIRKSVSVIPTGPGHERQLANMLTAPAGQVGTSGRPSAR